MQTVFCKKENISDGIEAFANFFTAIENKTRQAARGLKKSVLM